MKGPVTCVVGPISEAFGRATAVMIVMIFMVGAGPWGGVEAASADPTPANSAASSAFCAAVSNFDVRWPQVNLDFPGRPFFSDGNNDGIADLLQLAPGRLPSLASDLDALAGQAPVGVQGGLQTLAGDVKALAGQSAPATAEQSRHEVGPVERSAAVLQRDLRTTCGSPDPFAATPADESAGPASGSGETQWSTAIAVTIIAAILMLPLIYQVLKVMRPLTISADAGRLKIGLLKGFNLRHITGTVEDARSRDVVTGGSALFDVNTGMIVGRVQWTTTQYETIYIRRWADHQIKAVNIVNYNFRPPWGHVVSIWNAHRGGTYFTIAAINHTTRQEYFNDVQLYEVMKSKWSQILFVLYICFMIIPVCILSVFGGMGLPAILFFLLLILYVMGLRKTQRRFKGRGLNPIRNVSSREASQVPALG